MGDRQWRKFGGPLWFALLALLLVGVFARAIQLQNSEESNRYALESEELARRQAEGAVVLASARLQEVLDYCRSGDGWLILYQQPFALAWTRNGVDAYVFDGPDSRSLRQVRCTASGPQFGSRIVRPLLASLPLEEPLASVPSDTDIAAWSLAVGYSDSPWESDLLAVELLLDSSDSSVLRREWRGLEGGARSTLRRVAVDGLDRAPSRVDFPLLIAEPPFPFADGQRPPSPTEIRVHNWANEPLAALDALLPQLPESALISEITLRDEVMEVTITGRVPNFDGKPPAPFGRMIFDAFGVPSSSLWYPYETGGFGCDVGRSLQDVRSELESVLRPGRHSSLWYSCSTAYSDGRRGVWHISPD
ncbi:MAG: hypothetical protein K8J08_13230 [Thermoanaerobaculia bacterium]|nr:hypothetical protein [Thermoanaerobaculia bacterium]